MPLLSSSSSPPLSSPPPAPFYLTLFYNVALLKTHTFFFLLFFAFLPLSFLLPHFPVFVHIQIDQRVGGCSWGSRYICLYECSTHTHTRETCRWTEQTIPLHLASSSLVACTRGGTCFSKGKGVGGREGGKGYMCVSYLFCRQKYRLLHSLPPSLPPYLANPMLLLRRSISI